MSESVQWRIKTFTTLAGKNASLQVQDNSQAQLKQKFKKDQNTIYLTINLTVVKYKTFWFLLLLKPWTNTLCHLRFLSDLSPVSSLLSSSRSRDTVSSMLELSVSEGLAASSSASVFFTTSAESVWSFDFNAWLSTSGVDDFGFLLCCPAWGLTDMDVVSTRLLGQFPDRSSLLTSFVEAKAFSFLLKETSLSLCAPLMK